MSITFALSGLGYGVYQRKMRKKTIQNKQSHNILLPELPKIVKKEFLNSKTVKEVNTFIKQTEIMEKEELVTT